MTSVADPAGRHRDRYVTRDKRSHRSEVLQFLRAHAGTSYSVCQLALVLGREYGEVRAAIDLLTYADTRLCEDDDGALMYLSRRV